MFPLFEWDSHKAEINRLKHRIKFEESMTVFDDPNRLTLFDKEHSTAAEAREIVIGRSDARHVLFVAFTQRAGRIRLITARRATPKEKKRYDQQAF